MPFRAGARRISSTVPKEGTSGTWTGTNTSIGTDSRHVHGEESFGHVTDVNLKGTFWRIQAFAGMRRKRGGPGCIVSIGGLDGLTRYVTGQTHDA